MSQIFEQLLEDYQKSGTQAEIDTSDGCETLRIILEGLGGSKTGVVVTELSRIPFEEDTGYAYYNCYTTIAKELNAEKSAKIITALNEINLNTMVGAYGVLSEYDMLYHKYSMRVPSADDNNAYSYISGALSMVFATIDYEYDNLLNAIM